MKKLLFLTLIIKACLPQNDTNAFSLSKMISIGNNVVNNITKPLNEYIYKPINNISGKIFIYSIKQIANGIHNDAMNKMFKVEYPYKRNTDAIEKEFDIIDAFDVRYTRSEQTEILDNDDNSFVINDSNININEINENYFNDYAIENNAFDKNRDSYRNVSIESNESDFEIL